MIDYQRLFKGSLLINNQTAFQWLATAIESERRRCAALCDQVIDLYAEGRTSDTYNAQAVRKARRGYR